MQLIYWAFGVLCASLVVLGHRIDQADTRMQGYLDQATQDIIQRLRKADKRWYTIKIESVTVQIGISGGAHYVYDVTFKALTNLNDVYAMTKHCKVYVAVFDWGYEKLDEDPFCSVELTLRE